MDRVQVQEVLDDFVIKNDQQIDRVSSENPLLYSAVIDAIDYLSGRFGTGVHIPKVEKKVDVVEEIKEEEVKKPKKIKIISVKRPKKSVDTIKSLTKAIEGLELLESFGTLEPSEKDELENLSQKLKDLSK